MRVLHVAESAKGGVGSYLGCVATHQLHALGPGEVRVVVPAEHRAQLGTVPSDAVRTYDRAGRSARSLAMLAKAVVAEVRAFRPEVIHAHSTFAGLVVRTLFAAVPRRPAIVYCPHGWAFNVEADHWKREAVAGLEWIVAHACDKIIAISEHEAAEAERIGIDARRVRVVANGLPEDFVSTSQPWTDARLKVLFIGRLDRQKGADILLEAVRPLRDRICVRVAGASVADSVEVVPPDNTEMLGWLDPGRIAGQIHAADVVVAPSRWEGFGLSALEAMRGARSVVASRVGGLCEVIEDGITGRLTPPGDPPALARALLADDADTRRVMGAHGRARFLQRFTAERMNAELLAVYGQVARRHPAGRSDARPVLAVQGG